MIDHRALRAVAAGTALTAAMALLACSSDRGDGSLVGEPATVSHVHGLGVAADGTLYAATHFGLLRHAGDGAFVYASADRSDHMGFSLHPDGGMYRSGHSADRPSLGAESSTDGAAWTHLSDVLEPPADFHAMAVSFADARTLWGWDSGGRGTFRSTDGGRTWTELSPRGLASQVYVLAGSVEPRVVYAGTPAGLFRSSDGGDTWSHVSGTGDGWVIGVATDPRDADHLIASTQGGVRTSRDRGRTWSDAAASLPDEVLHLAISPADGEVAYAADATQIHVSRDGGRTWAELGA